MLLAPCCLLLASCRLLLASCFLLLASCFLLPASCVLLLVSRFLLLASCSLPAQPLGAIWTERGGSFTTVSPSPTTGLGGTWNLDPSFFFSALKSQKSKFSKITSKMKRIPVALEMAPGRSWPDLVLFQDALGTPRRAQQAAKIDKIGFWSRQGRCC